MTLSLPFCSWNNPTLTIPLKPIGFTEREWKNWLSPLTEVTHLFILFLLFIHRAFKSLSQFPAVPARFIHPLLTGASEPPKLCRSVSEQWGCLITDLFLCVFVCLCDEDWMPFRSCAVVEEVIIVCSWFLTPPSVPCRHADSTCLCRPPLCAGVCVRTRERACVRIYVSI